MICTGLILSLHCALNRLWCVLSDISGYVPLLAVLCISICSNCENPPQDESHGMIKVKQTYRSNLWVVLTRLSHMLVETSNPGCVTEATLVNRAWGCECVFVCVCVVSDSACHCRCWARHTSSAMRTLGNSSSSSLTQRDSLWVSVHTEAIWVLAGCSQLGSN